MDISTSQIKYDSAIRLLLTKNYVSAVREFENIIEASGAHTAQALLQLGLIYVTCPHLCPQKEHHCRIAFRTIARSADSGCSLALFYLGQFFLTGKCRNYPYERNVNVSVCAFLLMFWCFSFCHN
jgi:hypothetical protein